MRRDLIIGILASILLHGGVAIGGEILKNRPKKVVQKEETPTIEIMKMPELPPEEPDFVDEPTFLDHFA